MNIEQTSQQAVKVDVLLFSQRRVSDLVAYCLAYEFEDVFADVTSCQRIDAADMPGLQLSRRVHKLAHMVTGSPGLGRRLALKPRSAVALDSHFDLFFPVFNNFFELYSLASIQDWRRHCRTAACFITEIGAVEMPVYQLEYLRNFDHIFLGSQTDLKEVARITGRPCSYLPLAVDVPRFAPSAADLPRPIDVCNIGRRSPVTHKALIELAGRDQRVFYYYDTVSASGYDKRDRTFRVDDPGEHRFMLANLLKRSRYYIANRGYINKPELARANNAISARYYEGAAAGAVMIGEAPVAEEFRQQFDWPDAVVHVPFHASNIADILVELNEQPGRLQAIRRTNIREAALRHDWLHRIQTVFAVLGLPPTTGMKAREQQLARLASLASESTVSAGA